MAVGRGRETVSIEPIEPMVKGPGVANSQGGPESAEDVGVGSGPRRAEKGTLVARPFSLFTLNPGLQTKVLIAFIAALGAAVAPVTAYVSKQQEIALERTKQLHLEAVQNIEQAHKIRMDFLEKVVSFERDRPDDSYYRRDVLKFFASTLDAGQLRDWASNELAKAQEEVEKNEKLRAQLHSAEEQVVEARRDVEANRVNAKKLAAELDLARRRGAASGAQLARLTKTQHELSEELTTKEAQLAIQEANARALEERASAYKALASTGGPCPPGSTLQTSHGANPEDLAACTRSAPAKVGKMTIWSLQTANGELNCTCR
jgi:hypothetical protein